MMLNFDRMDSARYAPVEDTGSLRDPAYSWPGDMQGRALLSFVRLERATGRTSANLAGLRAVWAAHLNEWGYFGKKIDPQAIDEQQLAGHGWVLRALCELYDWKHDPAVLEEIRTIVKNLALPTLGAYASYPIDPALRAKGKGGIIGEKAQHTGRWILSSDIGCNMIFMDGLMHAATLLHDPETDALCEEILARNLQMDLVGIQAQTHASLTGARGMLRWAVYKNRPELVLEARKRFDLYTSEAMSENNENWNWFGRPTHSEPCAVIDSFMVANQLWQLTGDPAYLALAQRIVYNGFFAEQGPNGGFGCSTISGAEGRRGIGISFPEAWFCCSMRAGEGFAELCNRSLYHDASGIFVTGLNPGRFELPIMGGILAGTASGGYPFEGEWNLDVKAAPASPLLWRFFLPPWGSKPRVTLNGKPLQSTVENGFASVSIGLKAGDKLSYGFEQGLYLRDVTNRHSKKGFATYNYGPMILALPPGAPETVSLPPLNEWHWDSVGHCAVAKGSKAVLTPLGERFDRSEQDPKVYGRQLLFNKPALVNR
jgi:hypothetical protein